jgi:hypothetical protein
LQRKNSRLDWLFKEKDKGSEDSIDQDLRTFKEITDAVAGVLESIYVDTKILLDDELLTYLHGVISDKWFNVYTPEYPWYLDQYLTNEKFIPDSVTRMDEDYILTLSIKQYPPKTRAAFMSRLLESREVCRVTTRVQLLNKAMSKKEIKSYQTLHFKRRKSAGAQMMEAATKEDAVLQDTEALKNDRGCLRGDGNLV